MLTLLEKFRMDFLPEFRTPVTIPELPGFICFARTSPEPEDEIGREEPVK
jgi:hypothetical protein